MVNHSLPDLDNQPVHLLLSHHSFECRLHVVLIWVVNCFRLLFFFSNVGFQLFLKFKELSEVFNNVNFDLSFVNSNIVRLFSLGNRLDSFRRRLATKERKKLIPESMNLFANGNDFISTGFNLDKRLFSLLVKITASLDVLNKTSRK